ncbi:MAG: NifB/NifX family molybdenum-iron cluster-binding protein [Intestinibaculum porci]
MRIAVTYEEGMIFLHFGRTQAFKFYEREQLSGTRISRI